MRKVIVLLLLFVFHLKILFKNSVKTIFSSIYWQNIEKIFQKSPSCELKIDRNVSGARYVSKDVSLL